MSVVTLRAEQHSPEGGPSHQHPIDEHRTGRTPWVVIKAGGGIGAVVLTFALFTNSLARVPDLACFFMKRCYDVSEVAKPVHSDWSAIIERAQVEVPVPSAGAAALAALRTNRYVENEGLGMRDSIVSSQVARVQSSDQWRASKLMRFLKLNCERNCN